MTNTLQTQMQAKYKRAQAALLNLQADALELKAEQKLENLTDELRKKYETALSESEDLFEKMKNKSEDVGLEVIESLENQTYALHSELQSVKQEIKKQ